MRDPIIREIRIIPIESPKPCFCIRGIDLLGYISIKDNMYHPPAKANLR